MLNGKWKKRFARWLKLRFAILYLFGTWAVVCGFSTDFSIMRSIWFIVLGLAIRSWANCYAIKLDKLTTSGPYGYVRHPLYFGSFLIMIGFLIMLNVHWLISLFCVLIVIGVVYKITVQKEEGMLRDKFDQEYIQYQKEVSAFMPRLFPYQGGQKWGPSLERYLRSQEYKLLIWMIILVIAFHIKEEILLEHESIDAKIFGLIVLSVILGMMDFIGEIFWRKGKIDNRG